MAPSTPRRVPSERQQLMVEEHLDLSIAVAQDCAVLEIIELAERYRHGPSATLGQESQNAVCEKDTIVPRSLPLYQQRSESGVRKRDRGQTVPQQGVILGTDVRVSQQIVGAFDGGEIDLRSVLLLQLHTAKPIGQPQFLGSHVPRQAEHVVEVFLACP